MTRPAALISSALQALTLLEAVHSGILKDPLILVSSKFTLDATTAEELTSIGELRTANAVTCRALFAARWLVLGDPYSRLGQLAVTARRCQRVSILEDGAATYRAIGQMHTGTPMQRAGERKMKPSRLQWAAQHRFSQLDGAHQLEWILHRPPAVDGASIITHRFDHLRSTTCVAHPGIRRVVAGSALSSDGHIKLAPYLSWLDATFALEGPTLFKPHRREPSSSFGLAETAGVHIDTAGGPIERLIHGTRDVANLHTLPSTPALTCQVVRPGLTVHIPPLGEWWNPDTPTGVMELAETVRQLASNTE